MRTNMAGPFWCTANHISMSSRRWTSKLLRRVPRRQTESRRGRRHQAQPLPPKRRRLRQTNRSSHHDQRVSSAMSLSQGQLPRHQQARSLQSPAASQPPRSRHRGYHNRPRNSLREPLSAISPTAAILPNDEDLSQRKPNPMSSFSHSLSQTLLSQPEPWVRRGRLHRK